MEPIAIGLLALIGILLFGVFLKLFKAAIKIFVLAVFLAVIGYVLYTTQGGWPW